MSARQRIQALWRASTWTWAPESEREAGEAIVRNLWLHWFPNKVAVRSASWTYSFWLGTAAASLFAILVVTGVLLMLFYVPSVQQAYWSMKDIGTVVSFGWLLRSQHRWAAHLMVGVTFVHMARVFFTGAYRGTRGINWLVGIGLLLATLLLSFTGYLLPWDQLAFWAVTVGTNIAREAPIIGPSLRFLLIGGSEIGQTTLLRFYVLHVVVIPAVVVVLFAYHMWRIRKDGGLAAVEPLRRARELHPTTPSATKSYSVFGATPGATVEAFASTALGEEDVAFSSPELVRRIVLVFLLTFNVTLLLSILFGAPLEEAANPFITPNPAKAPWYFLWLQELVASTTIRAGRFSISGGFIGGILVPGILLLVASAWPFVDPSPLDTEGVWFAPARRRQNVVFILLALVIIALMIVGVYLRGPSWGLYWPWQPWPAPPSVL
ncbi:MAG TPA: cytochrome b N-terminal domain-containing protein [Candidatus Binatia bacterium]